MNLNNIQDKIAFYKEKLRICHSVKAQILPDDPYKDVKLKSMNHRIKAYQEELARLKTDSLEGWMG